MQVGKQGVTFDETALKDAYLLYIWSNITLFSNNMPIFPTHLHLHELHIVCSIISYSNLHPEIGSLFLHLRYTKAARWCIKHICKKQISQCICLSFIDYKTSGTMVLSVF